MVPTSKRKIVEIGTPMPLTHKYMTALFHGSIQAL